MAAVEEVLRFKLAEIDTEDYVMELKRESGKFYRRTKWKSTGLDMGWKQVSKEDVVGLLDRHKNYKIVS